MAATTTASRVAPARPAVPARRPARSALLFWALALALVVPVWAGTHFPTEDGPAHAHWTAVYRDLGDSASAWAPYLERSVRWNAPNLSYFALQYALTAALEPHAAQKLIVTLVLLAWAGATALLARAASGRLGLGAFAALLLLHSWILYSGFLSFLIGVPVLVLSVALLLDVEARRERGDAVAARTALLALPGVVAYYSHIVTGALFVALLLLGALYFARRDARHAGALLAAALPTCLLGATYVLGSPFGEGGAVWATFGDTVKRFVGLAFWRGFAARDAGFFLSLGLVGVTLLALCAGAVRARRRGEGSRAVDFVLLGALCLAALYFVAPRRVGEGSLIRERIQLVMWAVLLPALGAGLPRRARQGVAAAIALLAAWQLADFTLRARRFDAQVAGVLAQARGAIPAGAVFRFPQRYEDSQFERSWVGPLVELGSDVALHRRAVLVGAHHPLTPFYWVRYRPGADSAATLTATIEERRAATGRGSLTLVVRPAGRAAPAP